MPTQLLFIPGPVTCAAPVLEAMGRPMIDHRGPEFASLLARVERGMRPIFGTATNEVTILGASGTGGLEAAVASAFSPGDRVLVAPVGVFGKRLAAIAKTFGLHVDEIATPVGSAVDPRELAARLAADTAHAYAGVLLTHNETSTGVQNDMAALSAAIGKHPATVVVDSVSGLGASAFEMDAWGFDVVVTASQKALAVPPGAAMVAVSDRAWERMERASAKSFALDLRKARAFRKLGQTPWTPPVSILYALDVALDRYHAAGMPAAFARHARYRDAIHAFARAAGLELLSADGAHSVTVVAIVAPAGLDVAAARKELREVHGLVLGGGQGDLVGKILRMGTMGDLSADDVMRGLRGLSQTLASRGVVHAGDEALAAANACLVREAVGVGR